MRRVRFETAFHWVGGDHRGNYCYFNPLPTSAGGYERRRIRRTDI